MIDGGASATFFCPSVWRLAAFLLGWVGLVVGSWWIVWSGDAPLIPLVSGAACIPLGVGYGVFIARRLVRRRPELTLTNAGVDHRQCGQLAWQEVAHVRIRVYGTSRCVQIALRDPHDYYARSSWWLRLLAKTNSKLGFGDVNLPENMLGVSAEQVLHAMRQHHPDLVILP